jgi:hypothetical protein
METLKIWPRPDEEPNPEADAFLDDLIATGEENLNPKTKAELDALIGAA